MPSARAAEPTPYGDVVAVRRLATRLGRASARLANRWQLAQPADFVRRWRQGLPDDERADRGDELVRRVAADRGLSGEPVQLVELLGQLGLVERDLDAAQLGESGTVASW